MMLEALVFYACAMGKGCHEASNTYYQQSLETQEIAKRMEARAKQIVNNNEYIIYVVTPAYAMASGKPAEFVIDKNWTLTLEVRQPAVGIKWNY